MHILKLPQCHIQALLVIFTRYTIIYDPHPKFYALFKSFISFSKFSSPENHFNASWCFIPVFMLCSNCSLVFLNFQALLVIFTRYTIRYDPHPKFYALFEFCISFSKFSSPEKHCMLFNACLHFFFCTWTQSDARSRMTPNDNSQLRGPLFAEIPPVSLPRPLGRGPLLRATWNKRYAHFSRLKIWKFRDFCS